MVTERVLTDVHSQGRKEVGTNDGKVGIELFI